MPESPETAWVVAWSVAARRWLRRRHYRSPLLDDMVQTMVEMALADPTHGRSLRWAYVRARTRFQVRRQVNHVRQWAAPPELLVATADRGIAVDYEAPILRQQLLAASPPQHRRWLRQVLLDGWLLSEIAAAEGISQSAMHQRLQAVRRALVPASKEKLCPAVDAP